MKKYIKYFLLLTPIILVILAGILFIPKNGIEGIDVSHHNGHNITEYVQNSQIKFLIAKATEGKSFKDSKFKLHKKIAKTNNILFGAYHFLNFNVPVIAQFENYKNMVRESDLDFKPILDVELHGDKHYPPKVELCKMVRKFGQLCHKEFGCYPIIYCNEDFKIRYFLIGFSDYSFWICNYVCNNINRCDMQQYKIDRINNIDLNKIYNLEKVLYRKNVLPHQQKHSI